MRDGVQVMAGKERRRHSDWHAEVAIVGILAVAAIVIAGFATGHDGTLASTGLTLIGAGIGWAVKNSSKERT